MKRNAEFFCGTPVQDRPANLEGHFELLAPVGFYSAKAKQEFIAQTGFVTNYVTGKKLLIVRRIVVPGMDPAAVIHDEAYTSGVVSRALADAVFLEAMLILGVARWRAWAAYAAVRACGWKFYRAPAGPKAEQHLPSELDRDTLLE